MATLTINIPDALVPRIVAAHAIAYSNPGFNAASLKQVLLQRIKDVVKSVEGQAASQTARDANSSDVDGMVLT